MLGGRDGGRSEGDHVTKREMATDRNRQLDNTREAACTAHLEGPQSSVSSDPPSKHEMSSKEGACGVWQRWLSFRGVAQDRLHTFVATAIIILHAGHNGTHL